MHTCAKIINLCGVSFLSRACARGGLALFFPSCTGELTVYSVGGMLGGMVYATRSFSKKDSIGFSSIVFWVEVLLRGCVSEENIL